MEQQTRRVIGLGRSLVVTIPPYWIRYHNLKKGDEVKILVADNGELTISKGKENEKTF